MDKTLLWMVDLPIYKSFSVTSSIKGEYSVHFADSIDETLDLQGKNDTFIYLIDKNVYHLFPAIAGILVDRKIILLESSEENKTINYAQELIQQLLFKGVRRNHTIVAIGGGITQDLVAFISSILFRGVRWQFYPTTLLAQCDSCIGSKSSINFEQYKNLLGTFNPPDRIYICASFLETLTKREIMSGIGEMLHYFFNDGWDLAQKVADEYDQLITDISRLQFYIWHSLQIKKNIIQQDEFDTDLRHIFNYGHTFGHAIEAITEYKIPHGQAISVGMDIANYISLQKEMIDQETFDKMHEILQKNLPSFRITKDNIDDYCTALSKDKKNIGDQLGCILTSGPGKMKKVFCNVDADFRSLLLRHSETYLI
jgi:3-dehydroquinate synthase